MAGSFLLIFFLRRDFSYEECSLFYIISFISAIGALLLIQNRLVKRPRVWMSSGMLVLALSYGTFLVLPPSWAFLLAPIPLGVYIPLYWVPFNVLFMELTKKTDRGMTTGVMYLIFPLVGVLFPLIGGASIEALGYLAVFSFAVLSLVANAVLIALLPVYGPQPIHNGIIVDKIGKPISAGFLLEGIQEGIFFITLPLLSFEFTKGELGLGVLLAMFALGGALSSVLIGKLSDIRGRRDLVARTGALSAGLLIVLSALMREILGYTLVMGVMNFALPLMWLMLLALSIDIAEREKAGAIYTREVFLNVGRLIGCILTLGLLFYANIRVSHTLAGISIIFIAFFPLMRRNLTPRKSKTE